MNVRMVCVVRGLQRCVPSSRASSVVSMLLSCSPLWRCRLMSRGTMGSKSPVMMSVGGWFFG